MWRKQLRFIGGLTVTKYDRLFDSEWHIVPKSRNESFKSLRNRITAAASRAGLSIESQTGRNGHGEFLRIRSLSPLTCPPIPTDDP